MEPIGAHAIISESATMRSALELTRTVADSSSTVLLIGETGVGKELIADFIHEHSPRRERPHVKVGLASLPPELLESEMFGHEKGAFTNAVNGRKGLFELAHTGTIFLDDIDDFPYPLQSKLLRVLEAREILRVGGSASIPVDVRLICATKADLNMLVEKGLFRKDLFYRINVIPIVIPPLRERREDIPLLLDYFLNRHLTYKRIYVSAEALLALMAYPWPGNVRQLRNIAQRLLLLGVDEIRQEHLPAEVALTEDAHEYVRTCGQCFERGDRSITDVVDCLERSLLRDALNKTANNKTQAAKLLHISLSTFRDKLKKHGLD